MKSLNPLPPRFAADPTIGWFRSIALFASVQGDQLLPRRDHIENFLKRHDEWYRRGVGAAIRLYSNRELSFSECMPLALASEITAIARTCKSLGYGFSVSVHLDDIEDPDADAVEELLADGAVTGLGVLVPVLEVVEKWDAARRERWMVRLRKVIVKTQVGLVGDINSMQYLGLLTDPIICGSNVTIYPHDTAWAARGVQRSLTQARPCFERFRVFIDPEGNIYPCLGLMVDDIGAFGHISNWPEQNFDLASHSIDLDALARHGPIGPEMTVHRRSEIIPLICERHLAQITSAI